MAESIAARHGPLLSAASFAARAHRQQMRKDGATPYIAHPFRVCLIVRHIFKVDDTETLLAALLHDTIEDTATDWNDIEERFGAAAAEKVAALSKDTRLPEEKREAAYVHTLAGSSPSVIFCKLADIFDNLMDSLPLSEGHRQRTVRNAKIYLDAMLSHLHEINRDAFNLVKELLAEVEAGLAR